MLPRMVRASVEESLPGLFCRPLLCTTDQAYAKQFYGALFGWEPQAFPTGLSDGELYTLFHLEGRATSMCCSIGQEILDLGPGSSLWLPCIAVESADGAATLATELGGKVLRSCN